jgi:diguanylate cyclase (GGDEF)-like protein
MLLPVAVVVVALGLFLATAVAGAASVREVHAQDRLLRHAAEVSTVLAEAGRAEALVAQLADRRTNPALVPGMRRELAASARSIQEQADRWSPPGPPSIAGSRPDAPTARAPAQAAPLVDADLAAILAESGPQLASLATAFAQVASRAARPDALLAPGQLVRGGVDGIYPVLRAQAGRVRDATLARAAAEDERWAGTVSAVLAVAAGAATALSVLMLGPVRGRLARQRKDAESAAAAREETLANFRRILDTVDVPLLVSDAAGHHVTANTAARRRFPVLRTERSSVADLREGLRFYADGEWQAREWDDLPLAVALRSGASVAAELVCRPEAAGEREPLEAATGGSTGALRFAVQAHPLTSQDGTRLGAVASFQDITDLHARTEHLTRHAAQLAAISRATSAILRQEDARSTVCEAARSVVGAQLATLFEDDGHGDLVCTAAAGAELFGMRMATDGPSVTAAVFARAASRTIHAVDGEPGSTAVDALSAACGTRLSAGAWIPVVSGARCRAVLVLGFAGPVCFEDELATVEILAAEAAVALDRHDLMLRLAEDAESDPLTGAANRRAWETALPRAVYTARATGTVMSVVILDLDHFKAYNDAHGHPAGDALLRQTVAAWRQRLRPEDVLARYGGEEFAVILPGCALDGAVRIADALRQLVPGGQSCSAGAAELDGDDDAHALVARADQALYAAKRGGRDRTVAASHG